MSSAISSRFLVIVWAFLVVATLGINLLVYFHALTSQSLAAVVMLVAAIKIRAVFRHYMELKFAPLSWQLIFDAWLLVVTLCLVVGFWITPV